MKTLLITGAAGRVGTGIRPFLRPRYRLRLFDVAPIPDAHPDEEIVTGDITNPADVKAAMQGADMILHLACAHGPSVDFEDTLNINYRGTINLMEAALRNGLRHVVFASSNHGWGFYPRSAAPVGEPAPPRPDGWYGISKIWTEATMAYYAEANDMIITSLRIGNCDALVNDERSTHMWISISDLANLVDRSLSRTETGHRAVFAAADCKAPFFDNSGARALGFQPVKTPLDHLAEPSIAEEKPKSGVFGAFMGGEYAVASFKGTLARLKKVVS